MRRGIKVRLLAFVLLSTVGVMYVGSSYLGLADRVLGRGYTVHVLLPNSGGLYEGSDVTYRGVHIGKVTTMVVQGDGLRVDAAIDHGARIPADAPIEVHNLSAVGEQYLDFQPGSKMGRALKNGDTVHGTEASLPVGEDVLLTDLSHLVSSLDGSALRTVVVELGDMFRDNATPLRSMVESTHEFIDSAQANEPETVQLLDNAQTVLQTQRDNAGNIRSFARDLAVLTGTLADSDAKIRKILDQAGPSADELVRLVHMLRSSLPPLLTHLSSIFDVVDGRLPGLEQLLVTFPRLVSAGPSALAPGVQKYGRVNLDLAGASIPACTDGYLPPGQWRPTTAEDFLPYYPAQCLSGAPINMRGTKYAPAPIDWKAQYLKGDK